MPQRTRRDYSRWLCGVMWLFLMVFAGMVNAEGILTTTTVVQVQATSNSITNSLIYFIPAAETSIEGTYEWDLPVDSVNILSPNGQVVLGTVHDLHLSFNADPAVTLNFNVTAGASSTEFVISTATLAFAPILNPEAYTHAVVEVYDTNNSSSVRFTGLRPDGSGYEAKYNNTIVWAGLMASLFASGGPGVSTGSEEGRPNPPPNMTREVINDSVSNILSTWHFRLTSGDTAIGWSTFDITPEPVTLSLLALGGIFVMRRRRAG